MNLKPNEIRDIIKLKLPEGKVVTKHNEHGHFYQIKDFIGSETGPTYPSVTGKLQILKDDGLINYKMNRAIEFYEKFIFSNYKNLSSATDDMVMQMISDASAQAGRISQDILLDAGDIGTRIHNLREVIFNEWIKTGKMPEDFVAFIPPEEEDVRVISGLRALQKFCVERDYIPVVCELKVYNHKYKVAGALDDIGLIRKVLKEGTNEFCEHKMNNLMGELASNFMEHNGKFTCLCCGMQYTYELCLCDLKTSNQFKGHYFFQVAMYGWMFTALTGLKPKRHFILKVSKEDGSYKIEDLIKPAKLATYARHMLKTNEGLDFIKDLRKDNQKVVAPLMQL